MLGSHPVVRGTEHRFDAWPSSDSINLVGSGAGKVLGGGPVCSAWGDGEVVLTERGLFVCDPARSEFVSVGWRNFDRSQLILGVASEPASMTMAMVGRGPILFQMQPELATTILGISGRFWYSHPDDGTARAKGAVSSNAILTSQMMSAPPPAPVPPSTNLGYAAMSPANDMARNETCDLWGPPSVKLPPPEISAVPLSMLPEVEHMNQRSSSASEFPPAASDRRRIAIWSAGSLAAATMIFGFGVAGNREPVAGTGQIEEPQAEVLDAHEADTTASTQTTGAQSSRRADQAGSTTTPPAPVESTAATAPSEDPPAAEAVPTSAAETSVTTIAETAVTTLAAVSSTTPPADSSVVSDETTELASQENTETISIGGPTTHKAMPDTPIN